MKEFEGKRIVVVGASSGLGESLVKQFAQEQAAVYALSRSILQHEMPYGVRRMPCDFTWPDDVRLAFDEISDEGALDIVITTAGQGLVKDFEKTTDHEMAVLYQTGLLGPSYVAREAYSRMIPEGKGHIVTVSSTTGLEGKPGEVVYSAVKQGLRGLNQALSKEGEPLGIEATCIFPGGMRSENFWQQALPGRDFSTYMDPSEVAGKVVDMLRLAPPHPVEVVIRRQS